MTLSDDIRNQVIERASNCCEYCRIPNNRQLARFQIDHIMAIKHKGTDDLENLCYSCFRCNAYKGSNVAAIDPETDEPTRLYNPRKQSWDDHFELTDNMEIVGKTPEGRTTVEVLRFNDAQRVDLRSTMSNLGKYPC